MPQLMILLITQITIKTIIITVKIGRPNVNSGLESHRKVFSLCSLNHPAPSHTKNVLVFYYVYDDLRDGPDGLDKIGIHGKLTCLGCAKPKSVL